MKKKMTWLKVATLAVLTAGVCVVIAACYGVMDDDDVADDDSAQDDDTNG